jgi:hypothetical protein
MDVFEWAEGDVRYLTNDTGLAAVSAAQTKENDRDLLSFSWNGFSSLEHLIDFFIDICHGLGQSRFVCNLFIPNASILKSGSLQELRELVADPPEGIRGIHLNCSNHLKAESEIFSMWAGLAASSEVGGEMGVSAPPTIISEVRGIIENFVGETLRPAQPRGSYRYRVDDVLSALRPN